MARIVYATREDVKLALDSAITARDNARVDRALGAATDKIHGLCHRRFYPEIRTMIWDWPNDQLARSGRLWLDADELISVTEMSSGGVVIPEPDRFLYPPSGPPFTRLEIDRASSAAFSSGDTSQRAISITGLYGYRNDEDQAGALAAGVDSTAGVIQVTGATDVGVGSLLRVGAERMIVTGKKLLTTGQTLQQPIDGQAKTTLIPVVDGTAFRPDEQILVDAESMLVVDIAGNNLVVKRAWDGSVLASHTGSTVYAQRQLVVERGVLGTTAAAHDPAAAIAKHQPPWLVHQLAIAEALVELGQENAGYARQIRTDQSASTVVGNIADLRDQVYTAFARKARSRAV